MKKLSSALSILAIAGVVGIAGLNLGGSANATTNRTPASTKTPATTSSSNKTSGSDGSSNNNNNNNSTTPATTEIPETSAATTPDTGLFTADGEFAATEGAVVLIGVLAAGALGVVVLRNRKDLFRGRVNFNKR